MANAIKPLYSSVSNFTITLASLASSTAGAGRQATMIDNSTNRYNRIIVSVNIMVGTSPTASRSIYIYAIRSDKNTTAIRDDAAGASDAAWTRLNAELIGIIRCGAAASNTAFKAVFQLRDPGPEWTIGVVHDTGVALNATGSNHVCSWIGVVDEVQ